MRWLGQENEEPFFFFLHTFPIHTPYRNAELAGDFLDAQAQVEMGQAIAAAGSENQVGQKRFLAEKGLLRSEVTTAL